MWLGAVGGFRVVGNGPVTRYDLCFQMMILAATMNSRMVRLEGGQPGAFTIVEE